MFIAKSIESLLNSIKAETITEIICISIFILFIIAAYCAKSGKWSSLVSYTPTLLTSVGIFGTFTGIVIGLQGFDPKSIDDSIEILLGGLKTAFITSLFGMFTSIVYKISVSSILKPTIPTDESIDIDATDIYRAIKEQTNALNGLQNSISGDEESTLVGQMKLMRGDVNDNHKTSFASLERSSNSINDISSQLKIQQTNFDSFSDKLWIKLQDFADMLSKSATEQVINALKEVISDFNKNLIDQFGDNFAKLNVAVEKMIEWQEKYKSQIEQMIEQYNLGIQSITHAENSLSEISKESKQIPLTMGNLKSVMEVNQHQIDELSNHLDAFKEIRDKAVEAVPEIRNQVEETVKSISDSTTLVAEYYKRLLDESQIHIADQVNKSNGILDLFTEKTTESIESVSKKLNESAKKVEGVITESVADFTDKINKTNGSLQSTSDHLSSSSNEIKNHLHDAVLDLNSQVRSMVDKVVLGAEEVSNTLKISNQTLLDSNISLKDHFISTAENIHSQLESSLENIFRAQSQEIRRTFDACERELQSQVGKTGEAVEKQLNMIDQSMNQEVERVMQQMGQALTRISGQFTTDYSQLVSAMSNVVNSGVAR